MKSPARMLPTSPPTPRAKNTGTSPSLLRPMWRYSKGRRGPTLPTMSPIPKMRSKYSSDCLAATHDSRSDAAGGELVADSASGILQGWLWQSAISVKLSNLDPSH